MNLKRLAAVLSLLLIFASGVSAQMLNPIKWRISSKMTSPTEGYVTLRAVIDEGWHIYSTELPEDGPIPTSFNFDDSSNVVFLDELRPSVAPTSYLDQAFAMELKCWEKSVSFTRNFRLKDDCDKGEIVVTVKFMGCNDMNCLPPKTETLKIVTKPFKTDK